MEIKELLGKYVPVEKLDEVVEAFNQEIPKSFIPKGRFNEVNEELKIVRTQLDENKKAMEALSQKANTVEEYEKKIKDLEKLNVDIETKSKEQIASLTKKTTLKELLMVNNAHKDAIELLVEKYTGEVEIEEGKIKNQDKLLEKIKQERGGLFITTQVESEDKGNNKKTPELDEDKELRKLFGLK